MGFALEADRAVHGHWRRHYLLRHHLETHSPGHPAIAVVAFRRSGRLIHRIAFLLGDARDGFSYWGLEPGLPARFKQGPALIGIRPESLFFAKGRAFASDAGAFLQTDRMRAAVFRRWCLVKPSAASMPSWWRRRIFSPSTADGGRRSGGGL